MKLMLCCLLFFSCTTPRNAWALDLQTVQHCIATILTAYNQRRYPAQFINEPVLILKSLGAARHRMTAEDLRYATEMARRTIRESFTKQSGKRFYTDVHATRIQPSKTYQFIVFGTLWIRTPKYTGSANFIAHTNNQCQISQVRIAEVSALDLEIRAILATDNRLLRYFK